MGQYFSRSTNRSFSQKMTDDGNKFDEGKPSRGAGNLSFKFILPRSPLRQENYIPPATYSPFKRVDMGKAPTKFYEVEVSRPARFVNLPSRSPLAPSERRRTVPRHVQNNDGEHRLQRSCKALITSPTQQTSIPPAFHFRCPDLYSTPDKWWELLPGPTMDEGRTTEAEKVVAGTAALSSGITLAVGAVPTPVTPPSNRQPATVSEPLPVPYEISPIMSIVDRPPSLTKSFSSVSFPESPGQQVDEEMSDLGLNTENYMAGLVEPYFFKASACLALPHSQAQREVWAAITVHLRRFLKGKTIAIPNDRRFFSIEKLYQLVGEQETSVAELVEYLRDVSLALNFTQLVQKLSELFDLNSTDSKGLRKAKNSGPVIVEIDSGPRKMYEVTSFFGVVHALSVQAMPSDRSLGEYIIILYLLRRLIATLNNHLIQQGAKEPSLSTSIGLLASFTEVGDQLYSRAVIGFSVAGAGKRRRKIIAQRKHNLPHLNQIEACGLEWSPGNCAESETFACYKHMYDSLKNNCGQFKIFTVSLTLNIAQGFPIPFCAQCSHLARVIVPKTRPRIIDLAS